MQLDVRCPHVVYAEAKHICNEFYGFRRILDTKTVKSNIHFD